MIMQNKKDRLERAGKFILQPGGYKAFIPKPLPPKPKIDLDQIWELLSKADRALARLDGAASTLPDPDFFVYIFSRREAELSSKIEGTQSSLIDVLEFEAKTGKPGIPEDIQEVINYIKAMNYGLKRLATLPVSLRLMREIHQKLMFEVRGAKRNPGNFRKEQNWIGPSGSPLENAIYIPPPVPDMKDALDKLERFIHAKDPMPFLIKAGLIHAQFETIHPFSDGNGRIGRLLITFLLCEKDILKRPLLYLSLYFQKHRNEYYDRLQATRERGDWEGWLEFFLRGVYEVSQDATETARKILVLRENHRNLILKRFERGAVNALSLLDKMYSTPFVNIRSVEKLTKISFKSAANLVNRLEEMGLLTEMTGRKKDRVYFYQPYISIIH